MSRLDISDGFDVHDHRTELKLVTQDANSMQLKNREELGCPACGKEFDRMFVTDQETVTFDSAPSGPVCVARTAEKILVLAH
ncbi:MAG: flagella cluster protein [Halobaculum sp.]